MKKILFFLIVFFPVLGFGQSKDLSKNPNYKKQNIEGLGFLKINKTTTKIIDSLTKLYNIEVVGIEYTLGNIPFKNIESTSLTTIYELTKDSSDLEKEFDSHSIYAKGVRVFYLNYIKAGIIDVNNVYLTFHNGLLVKIDLGLQGINNQVYEAFYEKYGLPESIFTITKPIVCQNGFGAVFNYEEKSVFSTWTSSIANITAERSSFSLYIDCKPDYSFDFYIADSKKMASVNKEEKLNIEKINSKNKLTKKNLEGF